jgi:hypothetical protein
VAVVAVAGWQWRSNEPRMSEIGWELAELLRLLCKKVAVAVVAVAVVAVAVAGWQWQWMGGSGVRMSLE